MSWLYVIVFLMFIYVRFNLSNRLHKSEQRLRKCEQTIEELRSSLIGNEDELKPNIRQQSSKSFIPPPAAPVIIEKEERPKEAIRSNIDNETILKPNIRQQSSKSFIAPPVPPTIIKKEEKPQEARKPSVILDMIKENWMGIFGSVALVIGIVFFGLTAEIMQLPEVRVASMMVITFLLLAVGQKLKNHNDWTTFSGWLRSIAAAVILFATLGAGGIKGIQFIHTPLYALCFLSFGILINILLSISTQSQGIASLHVILSIIAFSVAPQSFILLPIGALVAGVGLAVAYRSKWDIHLLLVVIAFATQNMVWTFTLKDQLLPWMHYLAIGCSVFIGLIAACVHYSKQYQSPKSQVLPRLAHITNWGLLTWNIWIHASFFRWTFLVLGAVAIAGFILASQAKRKKIYWLYYVDTLLSQLVLIVAIASMSSLSVSPLDLGLMILCEILAFNFICQLLDEDFLFRVGYSLQYITYLVLAGFSIKILSVTPVMDQFPIYFRMGIIATLSWAYHVIGSFKNFFPDDLRFVLLGETDHKKVFSITCLFGTLFFIGVYFFGFNSIWIQTTVLAIIGLLALWRRSHESHSWNISFVLLLTFVHVMNWFHLVKHLENPATPLIISRIGLLGLLFLDVLLVFGDFLQFKLWKKNFHHFVVYAFGVQLALLIYVFTKEISILIPGIVFLGISVFALEVARLASRVSRFCDDVKSKIRESMIHLGLAFLIAFISNFITVHLQIDPIWHGISLRWGTEAMGLATIVYWITFYPNEKNASKFTQFCGHRLIEGCLAFLTLCVFLEVPEIWRPFIWIVMAITLLIGSMREKWPKRLSVYSWMYLIASIILVAFAIKNMTMPSLFAIERYNIPVFLTISLQLCYAYFAHRSAAKMIKTPAKNGLVKFIPIFYSQPCLTVLLPVFVGIGSLFYFNFEKAILTLLWVGMTFLYLIVGLIVKSKRSIQIAMSVLLFCSARLIIFDLVQTNLVTRSFVFIGFGVLMLGSSVLYKKFKHRVDIHETV